MKIRGVTFGSSQHLRTRLFFWCVLRDIVPTGEHLTHRAFYGPTWCILCTCESESTEHLFLLCTALQSLWRSLSTAIHFVGTWAGNDLYSAWANWPGKHKGSKLQSLPLLVCWHIWQARNRFIFDNNIVCWPRIEAGIISAYNELPEPNPHRERCTHPPPCIDKTTPWAFFDGAANQQGCGGGFILYINEHHFYKVKMGLVAGTNNFAELITLRHLLHFSLGHQCHNLNIFGDSKIIINWFNSISTCRIHTLGNIINEVNLFKAEFNSNYPRRPRYYPEENG